jgi:Novel toxin 15
VVKKAIPKLIAMFIPGAGFISAILSIYDTVMVFVNKIKQIVAVVTGFIDSIVAIAAGQIGPAAARVEGALRNVLSLAINFLAGFAGLGKVADKIMAVINKIRAPIDKALDWLVGWIVGAAKKLGKMVAQAGVPQDPVERLKLALDAAFSATRRFGRGATRILLTPILAGIKIRYGLQSIEAIDQGGTWWVEATANPKEKRILGIRVVRDAEGVGGEEAPDSSQLKPMDPPTQIVFKCNTTKFTKAVFDEQLVGQQEGLNKISIVDWKKNRKAYDKSGRGSNVPQEETRELYRKDLEGRKPKLTAKEIEAELKLLAALHEPDLVAGGFNVIGKLGSRYVNSSIGSQWKNKVEDLEAGVKAVPKKDHKKHTINVILTSTVFKP